MEIHDNEKLEKEKLVIGNCLIYPDLVYTLVDLGLQVGHFKKMEHRAIFEALKRGVTISSEGTADFLQVSDKTKIKMAILIEIANTTMPSKQMAMFETKIIVEEARKDKLAKILRDTSLSLISNSYETVVNNLNSELQNNSRIATSIDCSFSNCLRNTIEEMDRTKTLIKVGLGIQEIDDAMQFTGGELVVVGARPGVGKTALLTQLLTYTAKNYGIGSVLFSGEMTVSEITRRIISQETGINGRCLSSTSLLTEDEISQVVSTGEALNKLNINITELRGRNIAEFEASAKHLVAVTGAKIIAVDYLQLINGDQHKSNRYQEISEISRRLKLLAMETKTIVIALAQLNRASAQTINQDVDISHLRDSGQIEQDANMIILLSNNKNNPDAINFDIAKNRSGALQKLGLTFNKFATRFESVLGFNESKTISENWENFESQFSNF